MPVTPPPVLSKQQAKAPTSMRYERVQDILENEPAFRSRVSQKNHPVDTRFGDKLMLSREAVEITEALHAEGKDAHKVAKNDVLKMAARLLRVLPPTNGDNHPSPSPSLATDAKPPKYVAEQFPLPLGKKKKIRPPVTVAAAVQTKPQGAIAKAKVKRKSEPKPVATAPLEPPKPARISKPEPKPIVKPTAPVAEESLPESELPPEKQPLRLPADFDPTKFPHYSVQTSIYGLLLSALNLSDHYEKFPNTEARQHKLEDLVKDYLDTCDALKLKTA